MADEEAQVHGTQASHLIEKIVRLKIYEAKYWKEQCFGLNGMDDMCVLMFVAKSLVDRAVSLNYVGGTFGGNQRPTKFLCLLLKMLQIQPERDVVLAFISNSTFKYMTVLGAMYLRLTGSAADIYTHIEPLVKDFRRVRLRLPDGSFIVSHMDVIADALLHETFYFSIALPRLTMRSALEQKKLLGPKTPNVDLDTLIPQLETTTIPESNEDSTAPEPQQDPERVQEKNPKRKLTLKGLKVKKAKPAPAPVEEVKRNEDMTIEDWDSVRAKLGLKPLRRD